MTNGSWTFFSAFPISTSYSIWTRGARLRAMNFCALDFAAMGNLLTTVTATPDRDGRKRDTNCEKTNSLGLGFGLDASDGLNLVQPTRSHVLHDLEKVLLREALGPLEQQRHRARGLVPLEVVTRLVEEPDDVLATRDLAGHCGPPCGARSRRCAVARGGRSAARSPGELVGQEAVGILERGSEPAQVECRGAADLGTDHGLDRAQALERAVDALGGGLELGPVGLGERALDGGQIGPLVAFGAGHGAVGHLDLAQRGLVHPRAYQRHLAQPAH